MVKIFSDTHQLDLLEQRLRQPTAVAVSLPDSIVVDPPSPTDAPPPAIRRNRWLHAFADWRAHGFSHNWLIVRTPGLRAIGNAIYHLRTLPSRLDELAEALGMLTRQVRANDSNLTRQIKASDKHSSGAFEAQAARLANLEREIVFLKTDFDSVLRQIGAAATATPAAIVAPENQTETQAAAAASTSDHHGCDPTDLLAYRSQYLQSPDLAQQRLRHYLPAIATAIPDPTNGLLLDLGCGTGDWLEVLSHHGFTVTGIEATRDWVLAARERGFDVCQDTDSTPLSDLQSGSIAVLSLLRQIERRPPDHLLPLLRQAWRVLRPGGLLILETLDPDAGSDSQAAYWRDPGHHWLIPATLLHHLVGQVGFRGRTLRRLPPWHAPAADKLSAEPTPYPIATSEPCYALLAQRPN